ncbi:probable receptor-like protein kinase At1g49730 [Humulus lupulus]|uniref:probable receptor-like protein kinase At1g49730 n=1 Tax=Humulus lupulus TaxID=3486 RepID=UPI002B40F27F|nr:probable receptor-like protein kinase At1g49730 [Humulus lupulus]
MDLPIRKFSFHLLAWLHRSRRRRLSFIKRYAYKDIKKATDGFHRIVYSTSHGAAYKAKFRDGGIVLVKEITEINQEKEEFYRKVQLLGRLHHRHLLALRGFSFGHKRLLVFDNVENGSLKEHLNDPLRTPLNWRTRLQIAAGVVAALEYLLLFNDPPIYHVSINSSNIMLDENFNAKLSDIGVLTSAGDSEAMPHTSCSKDCMNQECSNLIYQLGVLILELVTGQSSENGDADLVQWIQESRFRNSIHNMIDPDLGNTYDNRELRSLLAVAKLCIASRGKPTFSVLQIFRYFQKKVEIPQ